MSVLYSNEKVELWNPDTDEMQQLRIEQEREEAEIVRSIEEGRGLELLKNSLGFQVLETYLLATVADLKNKLSYETDYKKFRRLQEAVKAYTNVLLFVDYKINEGKALVEKQNSPQG